MRIDSRETLGTGLALKFGKLYDKTYLQWNQSILLSLKTPISSSSRN